MEAWDKKRRQKKEKDKKAQKRGTEQENMEEIAMK
jgi:hypothetical protein